VAKAEVEVSTKVHTNLTWGRTTTVTQTWKASVPLQIPPHKTYKVTATVNENTIRVPFTTTWRSPKTRKTITVPGVYKGICGSAMETNFFEVKKERPLELGIRNVFVEKVLAILLGLGIVI
jgi:hypothetical protein